MTDTPQPPAEADIARCRVGVRQNTMSSVENRRTMEAKLNELKSELRRRLHAPASEDGVDRPKRVVRVQSHLIQPHPASENRRPNLVRVREHVYVFGVFEIPVPERLRRGVLRRRQQVPDFLNLMDFGAMQYRSCMAQALGDQRYLALVAPPRQTITCRSSCRHIRRGCPRRRHQGHRRASNARAPADGDGPGDLPRLAGVVCPPQHAVALRHRPLRLACVRWALEQHRATRVSGWAA